MATPLADILFILIAVAIVASQAFILRSTARGMRYAAARTDAGRNRGALEWSYAIVPAIALVFLLFFTWRAMHPATVQMQGVAPAAARGS